jgi:hypothetical protein
MDKSDKKIITPLSLISIILASSGVLITFSGKMFANILNYDALEWMPYLLSFAAAITASFALQDGRSRLVLPVISFIPLALLILALAYYLLCIFGLAK